MNPEYVVSSKGKFMLSHNGFNFTMRKRVQLPHCTRTSWRCTYKGTKNRKGCKSVAFSFDGKGFEKAVFKGIHCHEPQILPRSK